MRREGEVGPGPGQGLLGVTECWPPGAECLPPYDCALLARAPPRGWRNKELKGKWLWEAPAGSLSRDLSDLMKQVSCYMGLAGAWGWVAHSAAPSTQDRDVRDAVAARAGQMVLGRQPSQNLTLWYVAWIQILPPRLTRGMPLGRPHNHHAQTSSPTRWGQKCLPRCPAG